jgi:hypothetical protein
MSGRLALRDAVRRSAGKTVHKHKSVRRGTVTKVGGLEVVMHEFQERLTHNNDFGLTQWVRFYDYVVGIRPGDLALFYEHGSEWVCFDIVSETDVTGIYDRWNESMGVCHEAGATVRNRIDWR